MNAHSKKHILQQIKAQKLIAILRDVKKEKLIDLCEALYAGGIRLVEVTYSADGSTSDKETAASIKMLCEHFQGRLWIGAGTVLTRKQVRYTKQAGGGFIICPNTDKKVIRAGVRSGLVCIPGALTPSEAVTAKACGADFVKLFPISNLGVDYFKAVCAPLRHIDFLAVGGIHLDNMAQYLHAGVCGFGIGSNITNRKLIEANDWPAIRELARAYVAVIENG